jgi:hypothetical protein
LIEMGSARRWHFLCGCFLFKGRAWGRSGNAFSATLIKWTLLNVALKFFCQFLALQHC